MKKTALFLIQAILLIAIAAAHAYALMVDLYWHYPLANRAIHFAGGLWISLAALWLFGIRRMSLSFTIMLGIVITISIGWEIFEVVIGMTAQEANYVLDTALDLAMDLSGGILGYYAFRFMIQSFTHGETVQNNPS